MTKACAVCGQSIGGIFGVAEANQEYLKDLRDAGLDIPEPLCYACYIPYAEKSQELRAERLEAEQEYLKKMEVCTVSPYRRIEYQIVGIASAHIALGTGPISQLFSGVTDFFGKQSEAYSAKMIEAESACLEKLKRNALKMGANAVIGMHTTYTELTQGHGMLLVCMTGTAIKKQS